MKVANPFAVLPLLLVALSYYRADAIKAKSVLLELQTHFGKTNFPTEYPTGLEDSEGLDFPQFGKVAIVVHNSDYNFWKEGELAPDYLKSFLVSMIAMSHAD